MKRRDFLKISTMAIGSTAFGIYALNLGSKNDAPLFQAKALPPESHAKLLILSRFILPRETSAETAMESIKLFDEYVHELSPSQQDEILQIMDLLNSNVAIKTITHTAYDYESPKAVEEMLSSWKNSFDHLILDHKLHRAYKALTELFFLGFYSLEEGKRITRF